MDLSEMIPENHLLKQIENHISFDFIYEKVKHLYSNKGRASIDPVILIKMLNCWLHLRNKIRKKIRARSKTEHSIQVVLRSQFI